MKLMLKNKEKSIVDTCGKVCKQSAEQHDGRNEFTIFLCKSCGKPKMDTSNSLGKVKTNATNSDNETLIQSMTICRRYKKPRNKRNKTKKQDSEDSLLVQIAKDITRFSNACKLCFSPENLVLPIPFRQRHQHSKGEDSDVDSGDENVVKEVLLNAANKALELF